MDNVEVTVVSLAYNHEKYIRKTLEGFVSQKTNFRFEVIVHDDASTDNTADIIREFEQKYPDIIKPIYQTENQYQKGVNKFKNFIVPRINGRYVAVCEGDDYWSDPEKLQKQFDIMEKNPDCSICLHKTRIISENGEPTEKSFPKYQNVPEGKLDGREFLSLVLYTRTIFQLQFHISSMMARADLYKAYQLDRPEFSTVMDVGDFPLFLELGYRGNAYYISDEMSCYRESSVNGWNSSNQAVEKKIAHFKKEINGIKLFDKYSGGIVHDSAVKGVENRVFTMYKVKGNLRKMKKMTEFYKMLTPKERLKCHLHYYMPHLYDGLKALKKKI